MLPFGLRLTGCLLGACDPMMCPNWGCCRYTYYFCAVIGLRHVVKKVAPLITTMQLAQMFVGCFVTVFSVRWAWDGGPVPSCLFPLNSF